MNWTIALWLAAAVVSQAQTITTVGSFNRTDGDPRVLVQDSAGNFYMVSGVGTVFRMTPAGGLSTVYTFPLTDIVTGLVLASDGNSYGTTAVGGSGACSMFQGTSVMGCGTFFKMTPSGVPTVLHTFQGLADGSFPATGLAQAPDGSFYGTTGYGSASLGNV
jgi:hypothetical protein